MKTAVQLATEAQNISCTQCTMHLETGAKYCGHCGAITRTHDDRPSSRFHQAPQRAPQFASLSAPYVTGATQKLKAESHKLILQLVRERLFLYMHCLTFLAINFFGLSLAIKCYVDFIGDEVTKLIMATTPLLFINCLSLLCMIPIRGTRREIIRLKEKINYLRFQIEYSHLL